MALPFKVAGGCYYQVENIFEVTQLPQVCNLWPNLYSQAYIQHCKLTATKLL